MVRSSHIAAAALLAAFLGGCGGWGPPARRTDGLDVLRFGALSLGALSFGKEILGRVKDGSATDGRPRRGRCGCL